MALETERKVRHNCRGLPIYEIFIPKLLFHPETTKILGYIIASEKLIGQYQSQWKNMHQKNIGIDLYYTSKLNKFYTRKCNEILCMHKIYNNIPIIKHYNYTMTARSIGLDYAYKTQYCKNTW